MKVICIDASIGVNTGSKPPFKEGEILTVEQAVVSTGYYVLEYSKSHSWEKRRFIPISNIDEKDYGKNTDQQVTKSSKQKFVKA